MPEPLIVDSQMHVYATRERALGQGELRDMGVWREGVRTL